MYRIIIYCLLLLGSSSLFAMDIKKVTPSDRAQLLSRLRQIQYAVNYREEPAMSRKEQSNFLKEQYDGIGALADKYQIPHPEERNFLWLCNLEDALKADDHPNKKAVAKALYEKAQKIMQDPD